MNDHDSNRARMINTTTAYNDGKTGSTSGISNYATVNTEIKTKMVLVDALNIIAGGSSKGTTLDTNALRTAMQTLTMKCSKGTLAFAHSVSNNTLIAEVKITVSELKGAKKEDVDDICARVQGATATNNAGAMGFGVGATDAADLLIAIGLYRTAIASPRNKIIEINVAKENITAMLDDIVENKLKESMDLMADTLIESDNTFWKGYQLARDVINLGTTTGKIRGDVKTILDVPMPGVKFSIFTTGTTTLIRTGLTDEKGKYNESGLPAGDFDLVWEFLGYVTQTQVNVHLAAGKELSRKIVLVAAP
jgi:hypothetical protein